MTLKQLLEILHREIVEPHYLRLRLKDGRDNVEGFIPTVDLQNYPRPMIAVLTSPVRVRQEV
jgi:hypothetical protein